MEKRVNPESILVITFTRAAAIQMQERAAELIGYRDLRVVFGTFHSVFFNMLRLEGRYRSDSLLKDHEKYQYIKQILDSQDIEIQDYNEFFRDILSDISRYKCGQFVTGDKKAVDFEPVSVSLDVFLEIYNRYSQLLEKKNQLDFDDMCVQAYIMLRDNSDIRKRWQKRFKYIMVDEFQDIDILQYRIVSLLAGDEGNLFVVGDDDQSIYSFRGANPDIMLNFEKDYRTAERILLKNNYRSAPEIIASAGRLIQYNKNRFPKDYQAASDLKGQVVIKDYDDHTFEADYIINYIKEKASDETVAILGRTNNNLMYFANRLQENNINFEMKEMPRDFYSHFAVQDILSYLKLAAGLGQKSDFLRIMNSPDRNISREAVSSGEFNIDTVESYIMRHDKNNIAARRFFEDIRHICRIRPYAAITYIMKAAGYEDYLRFQAAKKNLSISELLGIIKELTQRAGEYRTIDGFLKNVEAYQKSLLELSEKQKQGDKAEDVFVATLHGSKGLEYDTVFLTDIAEGIMPYKKADSKTQTEEERRLFYVGMTRARKKLVLCSIKKDKERKLLGSRFISELLSDSQN